MGFRAVCEPVLVAYGVCIAYAIGIGNAFATCYDWPMTLTAELGDMPAMPLIDGVGNGYVPLVATTERKTPQRTLVVEPADWDELQVAAKAVGSNRATVLRQFIKWYIRSPGARMPQRPGE